MSTDSVLAAQLQVLRHPGTVHVDLQRVESRAARPWTRAWVQSAIDARPWTSIACTAVGLWTHRTIAAGRATAPTSHRAITRSSPPDGKPFWMPGGKKG
jgi:hypothetical protein